MSASVQLEIVLRLCDPRASWPWACKAPDEVTLRRLLVEAPEVAEPVAAGASAVDHIGRVLYLAKHGWDDPIEIDVGVPCLGYAGPSWPVTDGNHRLWAAALRSDASIKVDVAGQVDHAARLLGVSDVEITDARIELAGQE